MKKVLFFVLLFVVSSSTVFAVEINDHVKKKSFRLSLEYSNGGFVPKIRYYMLDHFFISGGFNYFLDSSNSEQTIPSSSNSTSSGKGVGYGFTGGFGTAFSIDRSILLSGELGYNKNYFTGHSDYNFPIGSTSYTSEVQKVFAQGEIDCMVSERGSLIFGLNYSLNSGKSSSSYGPPFPSSYENRFDGASTNFTMGYAFYF